MKIYISIVLLLLIGCREDITKPNSDYIETIEDHETTLYSFPSGNYYYFDFSKVTLSDFDKDKIVSEVRNNGITLQDVWYKGYSGMCIPPGSRIGMTVIVQSEFVIRVETQNSKLTELGFVQMVSPKIEDCAYRVLHHKYH